MIFLSSLRVCDRIHVISRKTSYYSTPSFKCASLVTSSLARLSLQIQVNAQNDEMYDDDDENEIESEESDHDYLAEILAEEEREAEELAKLEAQMKELDEMKEQQRIMQENKRRSSGGMGGNSNMMGGGKSKEFQDLEEELLQKESEAQKSQQEAFQKEQEEAEKAKADKIAAEREAAFQAEIERTQDEQKRKALKVQKAKDAKVVRSVLKQASKGNHYAVVGLKCRWGEIKLGPIKFCTVKSGDIKKAYRSMARMVHPDKNRDGRAEQAFDALEKSAAILQDEKQRKEFDAKNRAQLKRNIESCISTITDIWKRSTEIIKIVTNTLGPFKTPIIVLIALII